MMYKGIAEIVGVEGEVQPRRDSLTHHANGKRRSL